MAQSGPEVFMENLSKLLAGRYELVQYAIKTCSEYTWPLCRQIQPVLEAEAAYLQNGTQRPDTRWSGRPRSIKKTQKAIQAFDQQLLTAADQTPVDSGGQEARQVSFVYQMDDESKFLRGYANSTGKALESGDLFDAVDQALQDWLVANNYLSRGGVIYSTKDGSESPANVADFNQAMVDPVRGFAKFAQDLDDPITVRLNTRGPEQKERRGGS